MLLGGRALATNLNPSSRDHLVATLTHKGVIALTEIRYEEIVSECVVITTAEGEQRLVRADTIVVGAGVEPNTELLHSLQDAVPKIVLDGGCVKPRNI